IDRATFDQILEMDDDEERDFSKTIVFGFFEQAEDTFKQMENSVKAKDLSQLSSLGHFLKGSSATLGLTKVKDSCEKIQHFGIKKDEDGTHDIPDESACLEKIKKTLDVMKEDYRQAEKYLLKFYDDAP
ncbi:putative multistep phosphorelay regulator 1, partial [Morchella conica CCBAS932]